MSGKAVDTCPCDIESACGNPTARCYLRIRKAATDGGSNFRDFSKEIIPSRSGKRRTDTLSGSK